MTMTHPTLTLLILLLSLTGLQLLAADDIAPLGPPTTMPIENVHDDPNNPSVPADAVAHRDVIYVAGSVDRNQTFDLFVPPGNGPFPLVLWIHGGAWQFGSKSTWCHMNFLLRRGFAVANVEYRFAPKFHFSAQLDDVTAALDFLTTHATDYNLDPARIAATGESAGGHLASLLGEQRSFNRPSTPAAPGRIRAVIDCFGPSDLTSTSNVGPEIMLVITQLLGGSPVELPALARAASPVLHVKSDAPPFLILHGTADPLVPIDQSERLAAALKQANVPIEFIPIQGAKHAGPQFWEPAMRKKMLSFLKAGLDRK